MFISYSSKDKAVADALCRIMEERGLKVWYAPRNISADNSVSDYAEAIVSGIERCSHFVVILSGSSLSSHHVLNEINLAHSEMNRRGINMLPVKAEKISTSDFSPAFKYYLNVLHISGAFGDNREDELREFVDQRLFGGC